MISKKTVLSPIGVVVISFAVGILGGFLGSTFVAVHSSGFNNLPERSSVVATFDFESEEIIPAMVQKTAPAVVSIVVTKDVPIFEQSFDVFDPFGFFQIPRREQNGTEQREVSGGTGFFVSSDGLIVTNRHVVSDEDAEYSIVTHAGDVVSVEVVAKDGLLDIAVLKVAEPGTYPFLAFGDSLSLLPGQQAIAIGNALGEFQNSVSVGVISGLARNITAGNGRGMVETLEEVIQTDAAINPGNSGGPLLNRKGEVVGVNVAVARGTENIGFAIPSNVVQEIVESVQEFGDIVRPYIGVRYVTIDAEMAQLNNLDIEYGALVRRGENDKELAVIPGSPADKAGVLENDIIIGINGDSLENALSLGHQLRKMKPGDEVVLTILRKNEEITLRVVLEAFSE